MFRSVVNNFVRCNRQYLRCYSKHVKFGVEVRAQMIRGVNVLADAVAVTMGPKGRSVILEQPYGSPKITKDGASVARAISLMDQHMNLGAKLVKDVADNTNTIAGDGTTTATVLARSIVSDGFNQITRGANPVQVRSGVLRAVDCVLSELQQMSRAVATRAEIQQVATISANGDAEIGQLIGEATDRVGRTGVITVKEGKRLKDELEVIQGLQLDKGYVSPFFVNTSKGAKVEYANAFVLLSQKKICALSNIVRALELSLRERRPLLIIAEDISGEALSALLVNKLKLGLQVCAVKAPSFGEQRKAILADISAATGATVFGDDENFTKLEKIERQHLGIVGEAVISKDSTLLLRGEGKPTALAAHIQQLQDELNDDATKEPKKQTLRERISALTNGVAVLHIGGTSEVEVKEKRDRITDALNATRAAIEQGIVPGGGTALLRCIPKLRQLQVENSDEQAGIEIICNALCQPCKQIAANAGEDAATVLTKVMQGSGDYGYDVMRQEYCQLIERGIIDPTKVLRTAIIDAAGVASLLSTTEVVITDVRNLDMLAKLAGLDMAMPGLGGMGDMDGVGMGGMGGMGGMDMEAMANMGCSAQLPAEDFNETVKSMPGMDDVEVHDINPDIMMQ